MYTFTRNIYKLTRISTKNIEKCRLLSALPASEVIPAKNEEKNVKSKTLRAPVISAEYRNIYPEFLPDPKIEWRNSVREKLERQDMMARRKQIDIPEFYVGSILAVTSADRHTPGKEHRFVGICIKREKCGLRANFILRNVIDHQGVEILYDMYDPTIHKVEVLRLEKRLDDPLVYLRDALPEYSTFDPNMDAEILPEGSPVPVNPIKVKLKPRPWIQRYERQNLKGVQDLGLPEVFYERAEVIIKKSAFEKYDLMRQYMKTIPEEEQTKIYAEIQTDMHQLEITRKKMKRKRTFVKPIKLA